MNVYKIYKPSPGSIVLLPLIALGLSGCGGSSSSSSSSVSSFVSTSSGSWSSSQQSLNMLDGGSISSSDITSLNGFTASSNLTINGSSTADNINLNIDRSSSLTGNLIVDAKAGNDSIASAKLKNADSVKLGDGDDDISLMFGSDAGGFQTIANANIALLDGGAGRDTIMYSESANSTSAITLSTSGAINFENIVGTGGAETITGDGSSNWLSAGNYSSNSDTTSDTLNGLGGNDILIGSGGNNNLNTIGALNLNGYTTVSLDNLYGIGNHSLNGGSGNDILVGARGEDTLDGGTGTDYMFGGLGIDNFVVRANDGSTTLSSADAIYDFTDGSDLITLDSLTYSNLTIAQGSGNYSGHVLVSITSGGEYLAVIQTMSAGNITGLDFQSNSTDAQTINGTTGNDELVGGLGVDTFNTNTGVDSIYARGANDIINVNGSGSKVIDGGAGTDTMVVDYSGINGLSDFTISEASGYTVLTYSNADTIKFKNLENLTVDSYAYAHDADSNTYWNASEYKLYTYGSSNVSTTDITGLASFAAGTNFTIVGGGGADSFNLNLNRSSDLTANLIVDLGAGNDSIGAYKIKNADNIDLDAGDDFISFMLGSNQGGHQTLANLNAAKLDGGAGRDTLDFQSSSASATIVLTTGGATNFENIIGTAYADTITGDGSSNYLSGGNYSSNSDTTADTLNGAGGNDILIASGAANEFDTVAGLTLNGYSTVSLNNLYGAGSHTLNGGAGNDILVGARGADTLDGGTGTDHMFGGLGIDTFVVRANDGSTTLSSADAIYDFVDGTDLIGLDDSLAFSSLTIAQGSGNYSNDVLVSITSGGEYLAIIESTSVSAITETDFTSVDIS